MYVIDLCPIVGQQDKTELTVAAEEHDNTLNTETRKSHYS